MGGGVYPALREGISPRMTVLFIVMAWVVLSVPLALAVCAFIARGHGATNCRPVRFSTTTPAAVRQERDAA